MLKNTFNDVACIGHEYGPWFSTQYVGEYGEVCKRCHHLNTYEKDYS